MRVIEILWEVILSPLHSMSEVLQILPLHPVADVPEELVDLGGRKAEAGGNGLDAVAVEVLRDFPFRLELFVQIRVALVSLNHVPSFLRLTRHLNNVAGDIVLSQCSVFCVFLLEGWKPLVTEVLVWFWSKLLRKRASDTVLINTVPVLKTLAA